MRQSYEGTLLGSPDNDSGILVATDANGCHRICVQMRAVSKACPSDPSPAGHLNPVSNLWPFAQWGLDILSPFPQATGSRRFVLVEVDYFAKWAEAEALANIRDVDVKKFVWKNIVTRF